MKFIKKAIYNTTLVFISFALGLLTRGHRYKFSHVNVHASIFMMHTRVIDIGRFATQMSFASCIYRF